MAKSELVGACGEFYVAAYLSNAQFLVALPRAGVPSTDMFVSVASHGPPLRVQVKTGTRSTTNDRDEGPIYLWPTPLSVIDAPSDKYLWYAYVWLNDWPEKMPEIFFVHSFDVVATMKLVKEEIAKSPKTRPYFWLRVEDANKHKGLVGVGLLRAAAGS